MLEEEETKVGKEEEVLEEEETKVGKKEQVIEEEETKVGKEEVAINLTLKVFSKSALSVLISPKITQLLKVGFLHLFVCDCKLLLIKDFVCINDKLK